RARSGAARQADRRLFQQRGLPGGREGIFGEAPPSVQGPITDWGAPSGPPKPPNRSLSPPSAFRFPGVDLLLQAGRTRFAVDDESLVRALTDLLDLVVDLELEAEPTAVHLRHLDGDRHLHSLRRG